MPDTLATDLKASVTWLFQESLDLSTIADSSRLEYARSLSDGTGADEADKIWHDTRTVAGGGDDLLDLNELTSLVFGATVTINLARVKAILIVNESIVAGDQLEVGAAAGNPFTAPFGGVAAAVVGVGPDSALLLSNKKDGWAVAAGSADVLRIHNPTAGAITYHITIVGTSA